MNDLISVIVPIYNSEKYLNRCIESIVNQTYDNLEILLIDDGSIDNSPKICDEWKEKDKRIKVYHQKNSGVSMARNKGIKEAHGKYIAFIDSDDYIDKNMYQILLSTLKKEKSNIAICNYYIFDNEEQRKGIQKKPKKSFVDELSNMNSIGGYIWNKLYTKDILKKIKFHSNIPIYEDLLFNYQIALNTNIHYSYIDTPLYYYIQNNTSAIHQNNIQKRVSSLEALSNIVDILKKLNNNNYLKYECNYIGNYCKYKEIIKRENLDIDLTKQKKIARNYLNEGLFRKNIGIKNKIKIILLTKIKKLV